MANARAWQWEVPTDTTPPFMVRVRGTGGGPVVFEMEVASHDEALTLGSSLRDLGDELVKSSGHSL